MHLKKSATIRQRSKIHVGHPQGAGVPVVVQYPDGYEVPWAELRGHGSSSFSVSEGPNEQ